MESNVLSHEPSMALFVPDEDPLLFYRQILSLARSSLVPDGDVWFEINEAMGEELLQRCRESGFQATLFEDFASKPRFLHAKKLLPSDF